METVYALAFFTALVGSLEMGTLMWARYGWTSRESEKPLHQLMFASGYRFFWAPKLIVGVSAVAMFTYAYSLGNSPNSMDFGLVAIGIMVLFIGLITYEAIRTKE